MEQKEYFESELGDVTVGISSIAREVSDSDRWDKILEVFSEEDLVNYADFSEVEDLDFDWGSMFPNIRIKKDGEWQRMFFTDDDVAENCFRRLRYKLSSYTQNHG